MTPADVLLRGDGRPDAIAVVGPNGALSFAALDDRVSARADVLATEADRRAGIVVPLTLGAGLDDLVELLALWRLDLVPAPLNARLTDAERAIAVDALGPVRPPPDTRVVLWTSGTSGRPRGVALSRANLVASAESAADRLGLGPDDIWLASLSPAHVGGLALLTRALILGSTLLFADSRAVDRLAQVVFDGLPIGPIGAGDGPPPMPPDTTVHPTHVSLVPTQLRRVLDLRAGQAPTGLRCALVGGAHAPASLVRRARDAGWPVALTYGATEMSSQIATAAPDRVERKPGTVGAPLRGVDVRVEPDGELLVRGPTLALGYVGRDVPALTTTEGWYRTGDLGRIDEEGDVWVTGRRIDRIVSGGVTIDAVEVEEAVRDHPAVVDCCVVGVPDDEWGERVGVWVEPVVGEFDVDAVQGALRSVLTGAKLPRLWHVAPELPRNANGKVDRARVRARLERD